MAQIITKGLIGQEDLKTGAGSFTRATSVGGTNTLTKISAGVLSAGSLYNVLILDGVKYAQSSAGLAAAIADLPATGGIVDARGMQGSVSFSGAVTIGSSTKPVIVLLGAVTITCLGPWTINDNCQLIGAGREATVLSFSLGTATDAVTMAFAAASDNNNNAALVSDLKILGNSTGCRDGLRVVGGRGWQVKNVMVRGTNRDGFVVDGGALGSRWTEQAFVDGLAVIDAGRHGIRLDSSSAVGNYIDDSVFNDVLIHNVGLVSSGHQIHFELGVTSANIARLVFNSLHTVSDNLASAAPDGIYANRASGAMAVSYLVFNGCELETDPSHAQTGYVFNASASGVMTLVALSGTNRTSFTDMFAANVTNPLDLGLYISAGSWNVVAVNLTQVGGSATLTGTYTRIGNLVYFVIEINPVTNTSSTVNSTHFSLPTAAVRPSSGATAADQNVNSYGVCWIQAASPGQVWTQSWTTVATKVYVSGCYQVA